MADFVDDSVTQQIVDAKNQLVAQGNRAQTIVDAWEYLTDLLQDAPQNGVTYGRRDGEWVEAGGSGGDGGSGDMTSAVYDPNNIESDAFARSNHTGTQLISTVSGLQEELDSKLEDAASDGITYGRRNGAWSVINTITSGEVFDASDFIYGTNSIFNSQGDLYDATTGFISVDATGTEQGVFPKLDRFSCYLVSAATITVIDSGVPYFYDTSDFIAVAHTGGIYYAQGIENSTDAVEFVEIANASTTGATNLSTTSTTNDVTVASDTGDDATIQGASETNAGVMTSADYTKLDGIEDGAEVNTVDSIFGRTGAVTANNGDYTGSQVTESTTPTNYTPTGGTVSGHLAGIDSALASAGGTTTFTGLTDTPSEYTGEAGRVLAVNTDETGVEFIDAPTGGGGDPLFTNPQVRVTISGGTLQADGADDYRPYLITQLAPLANRNIFLRLTNGLNDPIPFTFPTPDELGWSAGDKCRITMSLNSLDNISQLTLNRNTNGGAHIVFTQEEALNSRFASEADHDFYQRFRFNMTAFVNWNNEVIFDPTSGN